MSDAQTTGYIFQEQRGSVREAVELNAKGIIPRVNKAIDCTVLDISETGARVELGQVDIVPQKFKLYVPETHTLCECRVVRRSGKVLGLEFQTSTKLRQDSTGFETN